MTDQSQSGPPEGADAGSEPVADVSAALGPDAPTVVAPVEPGDPPVVSPPPVPPAPPATPLPEWRPEDDLSPGGPAALAAERPEIAVGAAFAGGLVLALILKRLAR